MHPGESGSSMCYIKKKGVLESLSLGSPNCLHWEPRMSLMVQQVRVGAPYFENLDTSASQNRMFAVSPFPTLLSVLLLSLLIL